MLFAGIFRILKNVSNFQHVTISSKFYCKHTGLKISTLFVPGHYGKHMYQIVKPFIDVNYVLENLDEIQRNCEHRTIYFDFDNFSDAIKDWIELKDKSSSISSEINEIVKQIRELKSANKETKTFVEEVAKLRLQSQIFRENLYNLEDYIMPMFQKIPNQLHPNSLLSNTNFYYHKVPQMFDFTPQSHVTLGQKIYGIEFCDVGPSAYYLRGRLAHIEQAVMDYYFSQLEELQYITISAVDFCKSFVLEACGKDPYCLDQCMPLSEEDRTNGQRLNLVGSSSLEALCAYFVNVNMDNTKLPHKYVAYGRFYNPEHRNSVANSLFSTIQSNAFHAIIVSKTEEAESSFEALLTDIINMLSKLNISFRTHNVSAKDLNQIESQKVQIELWSSHQKEYIDFAYVSQCNDFLSKRLKMTHGIHFAVHGYLNVVHAKVAVVPTLLGCLIENMQTADGNFSMPNILNEYMFK